MGGVNNQHTLPFGSVDDVRQKVEDNSRILRAESGHILGPCHDILLISPPENIVAMYDATYESGAI
jgi:uroporphyrinogen decarboxylase